MAGLDPAIHAVLVPTAKPIPALLAAQEWAQRFLL
jgi:hypothetical protein